MERRYDSWERVESERLPPSPFSTGTNYRKESSLREVDSGVFLYIALNDSTNQVYIGIGKSIDRIHGQHNDVADKLLRATSTRLIQTEERFSTLQDARMAEAAAIRVAAFFGKQVVRMDEENAGGIEEDSASVEITNRSAVSSSRYLVDVVKRIQGTVKYGDLQYTAIVTVTPDELLDGTGRGTVHGGKSIQELAERSLGSWGLTSSRDRGDKVLRLIVRMKGNGVILADWDLDADNPTMNDHFVPREINEFNPRGVCGMTLDMEGQRLGTLVTWSQDIRAKLTVDANYLP